MNPQYNQKIKTLLMLLILVIIIFATAGGVYYFLRQNQTATNEPGDPTDINTGSTSFRPINTSGPTGKPNTQVGTSTNTTATGSSNNTDIPKVVELVSTPVSGAVSTTTEAGLVIRYVDKATGHIFQIGKDLVNSSRITNTTLPKSLKTVWSPDSSDILFSYIRQSNGQILDTYVHINDTFTKAKKSSSTPISATSTTATATTTAEAVAIGLLTTKTSMVGNSNQSITISPSGKKIFYIKDDGSGSSQKYGVYISNSDGTGMSRVWSTSIGGWVIDWVREGGAKEDPLIAMYVKPISVGTGFGYLFNPKTKNLDKVGQGGKGFTMKINPSVTYAITSTTDNNQVSTSFVNIKSNTSTIAPFRTFPEKCAWSRVNDKVAYCAVPNDIRQGEYPESWYMGDVVFADHIWKVNVETGTTEKLSDLLNDTDQIIDAVDMSVAPNDEHLTFVKKDDASLWLLRLK